MRIGRARFPSGVRWVAEDGGLLFEVEDDPLMGPLQLGRELGDVERLDLMAPARPSKIVCVGRNYVEHAAEHGADVPREPLLFLKPPSSVIGPGEAIVLPALSQQVEHECELALVIGSACRSATPERAWEHVLGVTCANDVTARDLQRADSQWTRGKGFDTFCPLGPWLVTGLDEGEVAALEIGCRVNGELRQHGLTSQMVFSPSAILAFITQVMTLEPGDVVLTGTPAGVGPLRHGDAVTVEIAGIGELTNPVVAAGSSGDSREDR
jgi:2-keto-4-pentenoate hydratase/2-oxohepta-3-ene-1,7-dioic acid hydratase in catechol pathway